MSEPLTPEERTMKPLSGGLPPMSPAEYHAADNILDRANADPDDDAAIVARAALRLAARVAPSDGLRADARVAVERYFNAEDSADDDATREAMTALRRHWTWHGGYITGDAAAPSDGLPCDHCWDGWSSDADGNDTELTCKHCGAVEETDFGRLVRELAECRAALATTGQPEPDGDVR